MVNYRRIYDSRVKKFLISSGSLSVLAFGIFSLLVALGAITITGYSGDVICAGTPEDPCYAYINFTANTDIFLYRMEDLAWSTSVPMKDVIVQRSWGSGWRMINFEKGCTGSWCGCYWCMTDNPSEFSYAFREGRNYEIRLTGYKFNPTDDVKWSFGDGKTMFPADPEWKGIDMTPDIKDAKVNGKRAKKIKFPKLDKKYNLTYGYNDLIKIKEFGDADVRIVVKKNVTRNIPYEDVICEESHDIQMINQTGSIEKPCNESKEFVKCDADGLYKEEYLYNTTINATVSKCHAEKKYKTVTKEEYVDISEIEEIDRDTVFYEVLESETMFENNSYGWGYKIFTELIIMSKSLKNATWWDGYWLHRREINISNTNIDLNLTNFPVMVLLNSSRINYTDTKNNGEDIRFSDADGNIIPHEIERWDENGDSIVWVSVPHVSSALETTIYVYYGNPAASDGQNITGVWDSDFVYVYHLNNSGKDSTGNLNLSVIGSTFNANKAGYGMYMDGNDCATGTASQDDKDQTNTSLTAEIWINMTDNSSYQAPLNILATGSDDGWNLWLHAGVSTMYYSIPGMNLYGGSVEEGVINYYAATYNYTGGADDNSRLFRSGIGIANENPSAVIPYQANANFTVGAKQASSQFINDGTADEVRFSKIVRSDEWIKATYYSIEDQLITFGAEESPPSVSIDSPENKTYTSSSIDINWTVNEDISRAFYIINEGTNTSFPTVFTTPTSISASTPYLVSVSSNGTDHFIVETDKDLNWYRDAGYVSSCDLSNITGDNILGGMTTNTTGEIKEFWLLDYNGGYFIKRYNITCSYQDSILLDGVESTFTPRGLAVKKNSELSDFWILAENTTVCKLWRVNATNGSIISSVELDENVCEMGGHCRFTTYDETLFWALKYETGDIAEFSSTGTVSDTNRLDVSSFFDGNRKIYGIDTIDGTNFTLTRIGLPAGSYIYEIVANWGTFDNEIVTLSDGYYNITVWANDTYGNINHSDYIYFTVDTTPPSITIDAPTQNQNFSVNWASLNVTLNQAGNWCGYSLNKTTNVTMDNGSTTSWYSNLTDLNDGWYNVTVYCNDTFGNMGTSSIRYFGIDTTYPIITIILPASEANYSSTSRTLNYTYVETNPNTCWYEYNSTNTTVNGCGNTTFTALDNQESTLKLYINDTGGNVNSTWVNFTIDTIYPSMEIILPENITYNSVSRTLNYTYTETNVDTCWYEYNTTNFTLSGCSNASFTALDNQQSNVTLYINDTAGNTNTSRVYFTVDTAPPIITFVDPTPSNMTYNAYEYNYINVTITDVLSSINWSRIEYGGTNYTFTGNYYKNTTSLNGTVVYTIWANDSLGNMNSTTRTIYTNVTNVSYAYPPGESYMDFTNISYINQKNVSADNQTDDTPILNFTIIWRPPVNLSLNANYSDSCFDIKCGTTNNVNLFNITLNTSYQPLYLDYTYSNIFGNAYLPVYCWLSLNNCTGGSILWYEWGYKFNATYSDSGVI